MSGRTRPSNRTQEFPITISTSVTGSEQPADSLSIPVQGKVTDMTTTTLSRPAFAADAPAIPEPVGTLCGQGLRFVVVGSAGTLLQLGLYASSADLIGAQIASVAAWLVSTLVTNAAHRALTFGVRGGERNRADQFAAFLTCLVGLLITSIVLAHIPDADGASGIIAILAVNSLAGAGRFGGMRWWLSAAGQRFGVHLSAMTKAARGGWHRRSMSGLNH